jgi:hypothetical protein
MRQLELTCRLVAVTSVAAAFAVLAPAATMPAAPVRAQDPAGIPTPGPWPQTVSDGDRSFVLFAPQFRSFGGGAVEFVQVVSRVAPPGQAVAAVVGTAVIDAQAEPGADDGELELHSFTVESLAFGGADASADERASLQRAIGAKSIAITRRALVHDMQAVNARAASTPGLGDLVPSIVVAKRRTALVAVDGEPRFAAIGDTGWRRVTNSPFIVLQAQDGSFLVRLGAARWMGSASLASGYAPVDAPPPAVVASLGTAPPPPPATTSGAGPGFGDSASVAPQLPDVIVATQPTVLVSMNGEPELAVVAPGVSWVTNARTTVLRTGEPDAWWVLAAGRWFSAPALGGPWSRVAPAAVPVAFAKLPGGRRFDAAKASVPGTPESVQALVAAQESRSVRVSRATARCGVAWNGDPVWQPIDGTLLRGSANASQPVVECDRAYWCCDGGIWFRADDAQGPWTLCDDLPDAIDGISAASPLFPVTGVDVVAADAATVTFAYTPAYLGTCIDDGTVVFGTGWDEPGIELAGGGWAPQPQTFGLPVRFDADTGTFAPDAADADADFQPALAPDVLYAGWAGWGWCPGWTSAWAWGWRSPQAWDDWSSWWRRWNPYWNRWANARTVDQRMRDDRAAEELAQRERDAAESARAEEAREVSVQEAAWRERQAADRAALADAERDARARAEALQLRDRRDEQRREQDMAERQATQRGGPIAPRGSIQWWYQYANDYSHGYLSRATGYRDPRYAPAARAAGDR